MNCTVCHAELPPGARACPNCGTMVSSYGNTSYNDGTVVSSRNKDPQPPQPGTVYGSDPYRAPLQYNPPPPPVHNNPIQRGYSSSPNNVPAYEPRPAYTPPPYQPVPAIPPRPQGSKKIWLVVGIGLLIVVLLVSGSIFIISNLTNLNNNQAHQNATATALAQTPATPNSEQNPYPPKTGKLVLNDHMANNSQGNKWDETVIHDTGNPTCGFKSGGYHMTSTTAQGLICNPEAQNLYFSNIAFEAKLTVVSGESAGIFIRINQTTTTGYLFSIDINGNYHLYNVKGKSSSTNSNEQELGNGGTSGAINKGLNAPNLLAIVGNGNAISVYANGAFLESAQDSTYTTGQLGIYGESQGALDVVAADARAWQL